MFAKLDQSVATPVSLSRFQQRLQPLALPGERMAVLSQGDTAPAPQRNVLEGALHH